MISTTLVSVDASAAPVGCGALLLLAGGSGLLAAAATGGPAGADTGRAPTPRPRRLHHHLARRGGHRPVRAAQLPPPGDAVARVRRGLRRRPRTTSGPSGSRHRLEPLPGPGGGQRRPRARAAGARACPLPPAPVWPVAGRQRVPADAQHGLQDRRAGREHGRPEHGQRQHGQRHPRRRRRPRPVRTVPPDAAGAAGSGNPLAGSSVTHRRRHHVGHVVVVGAQHDGRRRTATATDSGDLACSAASSPSARVTSTATASSDGTTGKLTGSTQIQNMSIAGEQVTVNANGIQAGRQERRRWPLPISTINTLLNELGHLHVGHQRHRHGQRRVGQPRRSTGLKHHHRPEDARRRGQQVRRRCCPASLTSQLPVALPNDQQLTLDLATVQVSSTASPAVHRRQQRATAGRASSGASTPRHRARPGPSSVIHRQLGHRRASPATTGTGGSFGTGTTFVLTVPRRRARGGAGPSVPSARPTSAIAPAFKGIGAALVLLGRARRGRPGLRLQARRRRHRAARLRPAPTAIRSWSASPPTPTTSLTSEDPTCMNALRNDRSIGRRRRDPRSPVTPATSPQAAPAPTAVRRSSTSTPVPTPPAASGRGRRPGPPEPRRAATCASGSRRIGMALIVFGFVCILLGWYGAAHSPYLYQEIPYLISGGLLGVALVIGGGVLVRCAWSMRQVEEDRRNALGHRALGRPAGADPAQTLDEKRRAEEGASGRRRLVRDPQRSPPSTSGGAAGCCRRRPLRLGLRVAADRDPGLPGPGSQRRALGLGYRDGHGCPGARRPTSSGCAGTDGTTAAPGSTPRRRGQHGAASRRRPRPPRRASTALVTSASRPTSSAPRPCDQAALALGAGGTGAGGSSGTAGTPGHAAIATGPSSGPGGAAGPAASGAAGPCGANGNQMPAGGQRRRHRPRRHGHHHHGRQHRQHQRRGARPDPERAAGHRGLGRLRQQHRRHLRPPDQGAALRRRQRLGARTTPTPSRPARATSPWWATRRASTTAAPRPSAPAASPTMAAEVSTAAAGTTADIFGASPGNAHYWPLGPANYLKTTYPNAITKAAMIYLNVSATQTQAAHEVAVVHRAIGFHYVYNTSTTPTNANYAANVQAMQSAGAQYVTEYSDASSAERLLQAMQQANYAPAGGRLVLRGVLAAVRPADRARVQRRPRADVGHRRLRGGERQPGPPADGELDEPGRPRLPPGHLRHAGLVGRPGLRAGGQGRSAPT